MQFKHLDILRCYVGERVKQMTNKSKTNTNIGLSKTEMVTSLFDKEKIAEMGRIHKATIQ